MGVEADGCGIRVEALNEDISVLHLLADHYGSTLIERTVVPPSATRGKWSPGRPATQDRSCVSAGHAGSVGRSDPTGWTFREHFA